MQGDADHEAHDQGEAQQERSTARRSSTGDKTKKTGFMAKMKGEAKILLGKVEGKSDKVEEGKKMKSGEA